MDMKRAEQFYKKYNFIGKDEELSHDDSISVYLMHFFAKQEVAKENKKHTGTSLSVLKKRYTALVDAYVAKFCKKQSLDFDYWVADKVGEVGAFGDYFFGLNDIILDLESNQPKGLILQWQEDGVDAHFRGKTTDSINYHSYTMGMRYKDVEK